MTATPIRRLLVLALCVLVIAPVVWAQKEDGGDNNLNEVSFPAQLTDIAGNRIDVQKLAEEKNLVVVTLKATWCPVCRRQLERIQNILPKLKSCNVTFIVLSPGPAEDLAKIKAALGFNYPFVADEDFAVARSLGLERPGNQIVPCMFQVLPNLRIGWVQLGRNGYYFGDGELKRYFDCHHV